MIGRLVINGQDIDLSEGLPVPISYSVADIKNPQDRKRSSSKTIKVPGTKNNKAFFSSTYQLSLAFLDEGDVVGFDFDPTIRVEAQYYKNGTLIFDGLAQLLNVTINKKVYYFNIVLFSNFVELFQELGQRKIAELGWEEYDHTLNFTNIINSWDTSVIIDGIATPNFTGGVPDGFGYVYGLVNYGFETNLKDIRDNNVFPSLYRKEIAEKCFNVAGLTISSTHFNTTNFKRMVMGYSGGAKINISPADVIQRRVNYTSVANYTNTIYPISNVFHNDTGFPGDSDYYIYTYGLSQVLTAFNGTWSTAVVVSDPLNQLDDGLITIARTGNYSIRFNGTVNVNTTLNGTSIGVSGSFGVKAEIIKNGYSISTIILGTFTGSYSQLKDVTINSYFVTGDIVSVEFKLFGTPTLKVNSVDLPTSPPYYDISLTSTGSWALDLQSQQAPKINGDTINVANYLPDMLCSEFLKGLITEGNLYMSDPDSEGVVTIEPLETYYLPTTDFDDWSLKQDHSKEIKITPASMIEGKVYAFKFLEDIDYYNKRYRDAYEIGYGDYNYQVASTFQTGVREYVLPWSQTVVVGVPGSTIKLPTIISVDEISGVVSPFKGKPRCWYFQGLKSCDSWKLRNSANPTITQTFTSYPAFSHINDYTTPTFDWNFGYPVIVYYTATAYTNINLFANHEKFIREITGKDSKILASYFKLNEEDVQTERFRRLAMINGVLYRKNLMKDFSGNGEQTTYCELVRIIEGNNRRSLSLIPLSGSLKGAPRFSGGVVSSGSPRTATVVRGEIDSVTTITTIKYG